MTTLMIISILFLLSLFWVYKSYKNDLDTNFGASLALSVIILIVLIATSIEKDIRSEWVETEVDVKKTLNYVFVIDSENDYHIFKESKDYNSINDSTIFYLEYTINFWGVKDIEGIKYENN